MKWSLKSVSFSELSNVTYEAQVCQFSPDNLEALILAFTGVLPSGSDGNNDARFMAFVTGEFVTLTLPDCVVFDLRNMAYSFGDGPLKLPEAAQHALEQIPCIFVVSDKCRAGLRTLLAPPGTDTKDFLFDNLDSALEKAQELAREYDEYFSQI